ncbi:hypothetical protein I6F15_30085 [Bradyrhizobium sp. BRP14]|nr:hypothetical protein [Bradyrhizobium sp. BRP14]
MSDIAPQRCRLIDATLREGFQAAGTIFTAGDVTRIAKQVVQCGAEMIEVGHPYISDEAMHHTRSVVDMQLNVPVLAHARASRPDILAVAESHAEWVGIFIGVNEISRNARLGGRSFEELIDLIEDSVSYAKSLGLLVRFTIEDSSRTDWHRMIEVYSRAVAAGADRLCFADSVGIMEPQSVTDVITRFRRQYPDAELEVHFHNDRGLAIANTLAAIDAGVDWVSVSINGLGERCGITDHTLIATNLAFRGTRTLSQTEALALAAVSSDVARCSGQEISKSYPVLGKYAFTHTARLHVLAVEKDTHSYEWIDPALIGRCHIVMPIRQRTQIDV